jgi:hypothetical protein
MRTSKIAPQLIHDLVKQGLSDEDIARHVGWTVGTLRVRCSHWKISLRRPCARKSAHRLSGNVMLPYSVLDQMNQRARSMGVTTVELAADLLREIARDNLYEDVLARAIVSFDSMGSAGSRLSPAAA